MPASTERHLLLGLIALHNGMIDQSALVAAFHAWTRDKSRPMAEILAAQGAIDDGDLVLLDGLVARHLGRHGDDAERSLAAVAAPASIVASLAGLGDPDVDATLGHVPGSRSSPTVRDGVSDATATMSIGCATSDGRRFRLLRPHARGGLGEVFVALDAELNREVALKQILDRHADDPTSRTRFVLEAEITGGLEHPGIVPVYGLGSYGDGRPYYAMRLIRGDSLKDAIAAFHGDGSLTADPGRRSLALRKLLRRFVDVCNAIEYAHTRGVIHRDIKPANVIVGRHGETLVVDWGLAKAVGRAVPGAASAERTLMPSSASGSAETLPGSAMGTPSYMSPEQATGDLEHLGPRSDVYSLGATLYCLLTGRAAFQGEDPGAILRAVQAGDFPTPRSIEPAIDRPLEAVCLRAMALKAGDRYATPRALADDIERWQADEPVTAWREPFSHRAGRWARRNRSRLMAASAAALMAMVGLAAVLAVQTRANARLRRANLAQVIANAMVTRANADLQAANERERQRFDLAVEAIGRYHSGVSEDFLLKQDQFKDLRDRLLRDALAFYGKLEGLLSGQADPRSRLALGRAYEEVGALTEKIGSMQEALDMHLKALQVRRELAREPSGGVAAKADVGRSLIAIGLLLHEMGRRKDALASLEEARSELGGLVGSGPDRDAILDDLARGIFWTGVSHNRNGDTRDAMTAFEEARAIEEALAAAHPDSVEYGRTLSWCYNNIAMVRQQEGDLSGAREAMEESRRIKQKIADEHAGVADYRRDLANGHTYLGILLHMTGKPSEALAAHEAALVIHQAVADAYPAVAQFQRDLANGLNETGDVLRVLGRTPEARAAYQRAVAIFEAQIRANPTVTEYRAWQLQGLKGLGAIQLAGGDTAEAIATWRRAIALGDGLQSNYGETL
jgi:serine/threonine protein kinase